MIKENNSQGVNEGTPLIGQARPVASPKITVVHYDETDSRNKKNCFALVHRRNATIILLSVMLIAMGVIVTLANRTPSDDVSSFLHGSISHGHHLTIPTVLSILDYTEEEEGGKHLHVDSIHNPLYKRLLMSTFHIQKPKADYHVLHANARPTCKPSHNRHRNLRPRDTQSLSPSESFELKANKREIAFRQELELSWKIPANDLEGDDNDVIALYCPATETDPRKFRDAATLQQARQTGFGMGGNGVDEVQTSYGGNWSINSFPIIREDSCEFRYWAKIPSCGDTDLMRNHSQQLKKGKDRQQLGLVVDDSESFTLVATTGPIVIIHGKTEPTAIHLALTTKPTEMAVQFTTGISGLPIVEYAHVDNTHNPQAWKQATGESSTYASDDMCEAPANLEEPGKFVHPGMLHSVILKDLRPATQYIYRVGVQGGHIYNYYMDPTIRWSKHFHFQSAPSPGVTELEKDPFSYLVYGDQGCPEAGWLNGGNAVTKWTERELEHGAPHKIQAIHHFGDLSYAKGASHVWDDWFNMIASFTPYVPLMVGVGNHEYDYTNGGIGKDPSIINGDAELKGNGYSPSWGNYANDSGGECGVPIASRFHMPDNGNSVFWYSFNHGPVHTIMLSAEHDLSSSSIQREWFIRDLESIKRSITPWVIVESHRPLYQSENKEPDHLVSLHLLDFLEDTLVKYKVNLFLAGHYHSYLRTCAGLYKDKCNNGGLTHITVGSGGAELDSVGLFDQDWTESYIQGYGYGRITVKNATALHFEFVSAKDGLVLDDTWIYQQQEDE